MSIKSLARLTKTARNLEKPRPLKLTNVNRHSTFDGSSVRLNCVEDIMQLIETVGSSISNGNLDQTLQANIISMCNHLKAYGQQLETVYKDQLDRAFVTFRNGCREDHLDVVSRLHLLEIIELRAMQWQSKDTESYYKQKLYQLESAQNESSQNVGSGVITPTTPNPTSTPSSISSMNTPPPQTLLNQGEVVKSSGKYTNPTKIPNKNYYRDEVVIRNSDSGKVMGIKGRRVHMIEELSETIISFQRVHPGAKERLVQITGPNEEKILHATQLIEETIRRNASPTRAEMPDHGGDSGNIVGSSINSSASEDNILRHDVSGAARRAALAHSYSTNDANIGEYKFSVAIGSETIKISGTNFDLVWAAKLSLDDLFSRGKRLAGGDGFTNLEDDTTIASPADEGRGNGGDGGQSYRLPAGGGGEGTGGKGNRKDEEDSGATTSDSSEGTYVETPVTTKELNSCKMTEERASLGECCEEDNGRSAITSNVKETEGIVSKAAVVAIRQPLFPGSSAEAFQAANDDAASEPGKARREFFNKLQSKDSDSTNHLTQPEDGRDATTKLNHEKPNAAAVETKKRPERPQTSRPTKIRYTHDFLLSCALSPLSKGPPPNWESITSQYPSIARKVLLEPPSSPHLSPRNIIESQEYMWNSQMFVRPVSAPLPPNPYYYSWAQNY